MFASGIGLRRKVHCAVAGAVVLTGLVSAATAASATSTPGPASGPTAVRAAVSTCTGWTSSTTPPNTIRVLIYSKHSSKGAGSSPSKVASVPFNSYVKDVLPNEWVSSWKSASLQAGAVATKQYAWYYTMNSGHGGTFNGSCYDVTDDISSQRYVPGSNVATTNAAVDATWGVTLRKNNALFPTSYQATLTGNTSETCGSGLANYPNVLSQQGSQNCATAGRNFDSILTTYYPSATLTQSASGSFTTAVRTKAGTGYYLLSADGSVHAHGTAPSYGDARGQSYFNGQTAVGLTLSPSGNGYWILSNTGGVYSFGDAAFHGSAGGQSYFNGQRAVSLLRDGSGNGYWILSAAGGIYSYGDAPFFGAAAGNSYFNNQTAASLTLDASGNGYWILSTAGGIYSYGDAPFFGSGAGQAYFNGQSADALIRTTSGNGYWITAQSGGVYSYGDAQFYGAA